MSLKSATNHEMFSVAHTWATVHRRLFEEHPSLGHLLSHVDGVVAGFTVRIPEKDDEILKQLRIEGSGWDISHDASLRLGYGALTFLADWHDAQVAGSGAPYRKLRDQLWPNGLSMTQRSYVDEAGHAIATSIWLEDQPAARALLADARPAGERSVWDVVMSWIEAGRGLKSATDRIREREKALAAMERPTYVVHRNAFIDVVETLRRNVRLAGLSAEDRATLLDEVDALEVKAGKRKAKRPPDPGANPQVPEADIETEEPVVA